MGIRNVAQKRVSLERLKELLDYNPETGFFRWKIRRSWVAKPGSIAGTRTKRGYVAITIDQKIYMAHNLAWFYHYGEWPKTELDHRDTDGMHNAIDNLREATSSQNKTNQKVRRTNTTGFKGVSKKAGSIGYQAKITVRGKQIHLGYFETPEEAHEAYVSAANANFGEFARVS